MYYNASTIFESDDPPPSSLLLVAIDLERERERIGGQCMLFVG